LFSATAFSAAVGFVHAGIGGAALGIGGFVYSLVTLTRYRHLTILLAFTATTILFWDVYF